MLLSNDFWGCSPTLKPVPLASLPSWARSVDLQVRKETSLSDLPPLKCSDGSAYTGTSFIEGDAYQKVTHPSGGVVYLITRENPPYSNTPRSGCVSSLVEEAKHLEKHPRLSWVRAYQNEQGDVAIFQARKKRTNKYSTRHIQEDLGSGVLNVSFLSAKEVVIYLSGEVWARETGYLSNRKETIRLACVKQVHPNITYQYAQRKDVLRPHLKTTLVVVEGIKLEGEIPKVRLNRNPKDYSSGFDCWSDTSNHRITGPLEAILRKMRNEGWS